MLLTLALVALPFLPPPLPPPVPPDISPPPALVIEASQSAAQWPVHSRQVLRRASIPAHPWAAGHRGIDIAAVADEPVRAVSAGRVHFAGEVAGRPAVSVDHGGGLRTTYTPVVAVVRPGQRVERGEVIGTVAAGHCPTVCLHLGLRDDERYYDPLTLFETPRMRLWPSGAGMGLAEGSAQPVR
ncbi:MAG: M23 family metallopeptidase [Flaviflexus sp.]|nr:M23 family metallopeptidase [Flaviflexus sp.]